jgi:hypothetical protein
LIDSHHGLTEELRDTVREMLKEKVYRGRAGVALEGPKDGRADV